MSYAQLAPVYSPSTISHIFAPKGWDTVWQAAKAASGAAPANILWLGDSYMQGSVCTDFMAKSFRAISTASLVAKYGRYADFWPVAYSTDFVTFSGGTFNGTPPWVVNNTTNKSYVTWFMSKMIAYSASNAATLFTFTSPNACTGIDILHAPNAVGSFQYSVDAGAAVTVNTTSGATYTRTAITGLANTTHTLAILNAVNGNACIVDGVVTYTGNAGGIASAHEAYSGASVRDWMSPNNTPNPRPFILEGREKTTSPVGNFGFPAQPHLAVVALGLNDCTQQLGLSTYEYGLASIVEALRGGRTNCSILFLAQSSPDTTYSDVTSGLGAGNIVYKWYLSAQRRVAEYYNCAWLNVHARWGDTGVAQGFQLFNQQHPNDAGHQDIANLLAGVI